MNIYKVTIETVEYSGIGNGTTIVKETIDNVGAVQFDGQAGFTLVYFLGGGFKAFESGSVRKVESVVSSVIPDPVATPQPQEPKQDETKLSEEQGQDSTANG